MAEKNRDIRGRWRSLTIGFRVSPEENEMINRIVKVSGHTKQDFLTSNMLGATITVIANPKVYKALKEEMIRLCEELIRIEKAGDLTPDYIVLIKTVTDIYAGLKGENHAVNSKKEKEI